MPPRSVGTKPTWFYSNMANHHFFSFFFLWTFHKHVLPSLWKHPYWIKDVWWISQRQRRPAIYVTLIPKPQLDVSSVHYFKYEVEQRINSQQTVRFLLGNPEKCLSTHASRQVPGQFEKRRRQVPLRHTRTFEHHSSEMRQPLKDGDILHYFRRAFFNISFLSIFFFFFCC